MKMIRVLEYEGSRDDLLEALLAAKVGESVSFNQRVTLREVSITIAEEFEGDDE